MALVPFDDRDGWIWWDGALVPWREAKLHVLTHGLHYASAVFEGERAYAGNIFRLRAHTDRLINSARILGFEIPFTAEQIDAACKETLAANNLTDAYVRPIAWRGSEMLAVSAQHTKIHLAIAVWPWPSYFGDDRMTGHPARHGGVEAPLAGHRADRRQGHRPLHDRHPVQARGGGRGLRRCADAGLARTGGRGDRGQHLLRHGRRYPHADAGLLPGRHHPPIGDEHRQAASDEGGGAADRRVRDRAGRAKCSWPAPLPR